MRKLIVPLLLSIVLLMGCEKNETDHIPPSIKFVTSPGFVHSDTVLAMGESYRVGIIAENHEVNLTNFIIKVETDEMETYLDSGMNTASLQYEKTFVKGIKPVENWRFIIRDKEGKSAEVGFTISMDTTSSFGQVLYHPSVDLGAQNNEFGNFYSLGLDSVFILENAFLNQSVIDMCYYYDFIDTDENTIASPGANIDATVYTGDAGIENWELRRTTRYKIANITEDDFMSAVNDSLLIAVYGQSDGNRKAKNLAPGMFFSFKNEEGKVGLFRVNTVSGTDEGTINISIKVQE
jgi:hypothetical protein